MTDIREQILKDEVNKIDGPEQPYYSEDIYDGRATAIYNALDEYAIKILQQLHENGDSFNPKAKYNVTGHLEAIKKLLNEKDK